MYYYRFTYLLLFLLISNLVGFSQDFEYEGIKYTILDEGKKTCKTKAGSSSQAGNNVSGIINIPSKVKSGADEFMVTRIGDWSFGNNNEITEISIPGSVTIIDGNAFRGCSSLTSIGLPQEMITIAGSPFRDCSSLISI